MRRNNGIPLGRALYHVIEVAGVSGSDFQDPIAESLVLAFLLEQDHCSDTVHALCTTCASQALARPTFWGLRLVYRTR